MSVYMTVDPGVGGTGIALWDDEHIHPRNCAVVTASTELEWIDRVWSIAEGFNDILLKANPEHIIFEYPGFFQSAKGLASAVNGDVFKLMFLVGILSDRCHLNKMGVVLLPVNTWKGTLSKDAVIARIAARLGTTLDHYPNHVADAVGMGLHVKGLLNLSGSVRKKSTEKDGGK